MYKIFITLEGGAQMQITDVRLRKVNSGNRMKAIANVTFDNEFVVCDIKVIESQKVYLLLCQAKRTLMEDIQI